MSIGTPGINVPSGAVSDLLTYSGSSLVSGVLFGTAAGTASSPLVSADYLSLTTNLDIDPVSGAVTLALLRAPPAGSVTGVLRVQNPALFAEEIPVTIPVTITNPATVLWDPSVDLDYFPDWTRSDQNIQLYGQSIVTEWQNLGYNQAVQYNGHAIATSTGVGPSYNPQGVGTLPYLEFSASAPSSLYGLGAALSFIGGQSSIALWTVFSTTYFPASGNFAWLYALTNSSYPANPAGRLLLGINSSGNIFGTARPNDGDASAGVLGTTPVNDGRIHVAMYVFNNGAVTLYLDGTVVGTATAADVGPFTLSPASEVHIGAEQPTTTDAWNGEIYERGVSFSPTQDIIDRVNAYELWLFGAQAALQNPSYTGPYASAPPYAALRTLTMTPINAPFTVYPFYFLLRGVLTLPGEAVAVSASDGSVFTLSGGSYSGIFNSTGTVTFTFTETGPLGTKVTNVSITVGAGVPTTQSFTFVQD